MFDYNYRNLVFPKPQLTPFTSLLDLHAEIETNCPSPLIGKCDTSIISPPSPIALFKLLSISDGLFFIRYTLEETFKQRWFLVQINHVETVILNVQPESAGDYHVILLA